MLLSLHNRIIESSPSAAASISEGEIISPLITPMACKNQTARPNVTFALYVRHAQTPPQNNVASSN